ncbi:hypothetical protein Nmel_015630 [Mimus melanotis]
MDKMVSSPSLQHPSTPSLQPHMESRVESIPGSALLQLPAQLPGAPWLRGWRRLELSCPHRSWWLGMEGQAEGSSTAPGTFQDAGMCLSTSWKWGRGARGYHRAPLPHGCP